MEKLRKVHMVNGTVYRMPVTVSTQKGLHEMQLILTRHRHLKNTYVDLSTNLNGKITRMSIKEVKELIKALQNEVADIEKAV